MSNCFISDISRIPNNSHLRKVCMYSVNRTGPRAVIHFTLITSTWLAPVYRSAKIKLPRMTKIQASSHLPQEAELPGLSSFFSTYLLCFQGSYCSWSMTYIEKQHLSPDYPKLNGSMTWFLGNFIDFLHHLNWSKKETQLQQSSHDNK